MADAGKQMRFTDAEIVTIKGMFEGNDANLKLLRKVFLPEYDPAAPLGQTVDLWLAVDGQLRQMPMEQAYQRIMVRNEVINHIENQLIQLQLLAAMKTETPEEAAAREAQNSSK